MLALYKLEKFWTNRTFIKKNPENVELKKNFIKFLKFEY